MFGVVKALVGGIGFLDVAEVPFPHMNRGVTGFAQDFGKSHLPGRQPIACDHCLSLTGPCPGGVPSGHHSRTGRRATGLSINPHEGETFVGQLRDPGGTVATDDIEIRHTDFAEPEIVKEDVNEIWRFAAVFLADPGQFFINFFILGSPFFSVLGLEDVVLGIVYDLTRFAACQSAVRRTQHRQNDRHHY